MVIFENAKHTTPRIQQEIVLFEVCSSLKTRPPLFRCSGLLFREKQCGLAPRPSPGGRARRPCITIGTFFVCVEFLPSTVDWRAALAAAHR
jgi:hypothetical protein